MVPHSLLVPLAMFGIAIVIALIAWWSLRSDAKNLALFKAAAGWRETPGLIGESWVKIHRQRATETRDSDGNVTTTGSDTLTFEPRVSYSYTVNGIALTGKRIDFTRVQALGEDEAQERLGRFPIGRTVSVYYDPANPKSAVLDRERVPPKRSAATWGLFIGAGIAAVIGVAFLIWGK